MPAFLFFLAFCLSSFLWASKPYESRSLERICEEGELYEANPSTLEDDIKTSINEIIEVLKIDLNTPLDLLKFLLTYNELILFADHSSAGAQSGLKNALNKLVEAVEQNTVDDIKNRKIEELRRKLNQSIHLEVDLLFGLVDLQVPKCVPWSVAEIVTILLEDTDIYLFSDEKDEFIVILYDILKTKIWVIEFS